MCDIDFFKKINDSFGHSIGDLLLIEIVKTLLKNLRKTDLAFRYGGEEFLVLILFDDIHDLQKTSERLRESIEQANLIESPVTISIGAYIIKDSDDLKSSVCHADEALYTAKKEGRNRVKFYG